MSANCLDGICCASTISLGASQDHGTDAYEMTTSQQPATRQPAAVRQPPMSYQPQSYRNYDMDSVSGTPECYNCGRPLYKREESCPCRTYPGCVNTPPHLMPYNSKLKPQAFPQESISNQRLNQSGSSSKVSCPVCIGIVREPAFSTLLGYKDFRQLTPFVL